MRQESPHTGRSDDARAELAVVARREKTKRRGQRVPRLGRAWILLVVVVLAFLYYRPLATWHETRADLARREADVRSLRAERVRLERRLTRAQSMETLAREARRLGYVKPGERLFIVKGIPLWLRRNAERAARDR
jgi:cell division protein FtsB